MDHNDLTHYKNVTSVNGYPVMRFNVNISSLILKKERLKLFQVYNYKFDNSIYKQKNKV